MKCPNCKNQKIKFVEGMKTHRKHKWILLLSILLSVCLGASISGIFQYIKAIMILIEIICLIVYIAIDKANQHKTFTKCICSNCGKTWWLND